MVNSLLDGVDLVDHHCHGVLRTELDRSEFESLLTEADGPGMWHGSLFDTQIGLGVRRWCAPLLDLETFASPEEYLARRAALDIADLNRRLLGSLGTSEFLVDTGLWADELTPPDELAGLAHAVGYEIVRLEHVAEQVVRGSDVVGFADAVQAELTRRCADAVAVKTIAAYRVGLRLDPARPTPTQVRAAVEAWLRNMEAGGPGRLVDETLCRFLIWCGIDLGLPIQFHAGYGDADANLADCDPLLLTPLLRATAGQGVPIMLLHNYPFHRHAGYLAQVFDHVFVDLGLTMHNVGLRSVEVLAELLELAPFGAVLFSSDAFGLPELFVVATRLFRESLSRYLDDGLAAGAWTLQDAERFAEMIASGNARRAYALAES